MIKENKKKLILTSVVILVPIIIGLILWNKLPDKIPTHWNAAGEVDGWSSKAFAIFGLPGFLFVVHWVCLLASSADPKKQNIEGKILHIVLWVCPVISVLGAVLMYGTALGMQFAVEKIIPSLVGITFIIIGNYLPKCKQSYTMGIKLPWTLNDEDNWNRTHRLGGKLWVVCGLVLIVSMVLPSSFMIAAFLVIITVAVLVPTVYSYLLYREKQKRGE